MKKFEGKVAIVTGSTSGVGRQVAYQLAEQGAKVVVSGRNEARAKEVVEHIKEAGGEAIYVLADVSKANEPKKLVDAVLAEYGTIDILVNNAASDDPMNVRGIQDIDEATYDRVMAANAKAPFLLSQLVIPLMEEKGKGIIVNTGSIASTGGGRGPLVYTMSKHAVLGLTREIEFLHGRNGIRCNAVLPGAIYTELTKADFDNPDHPLSKAIAASPAGKPSQPEDIARVIVFLCSDDSWFIQGSAITADGGGTLC